MGPCEKGGNLLLTIALKQPSEANPTRAEVTAARAEAGHPAAEALRRYLGDLQANGEQIPLRTSKPNKVAIARACGFARDVLYDNVCAIEQINTHFTSPADIRASQ